MQQQLDAVLYSCCNTPLIPVGSTTVLCIQFNFSVQCMYNKPRTNLLAEITMEVSEQTHMYRNTTCNEYKDCTVSAFTSLKYIMSSTAITRQYNYPCQNNPLKYTSHWMSWWVSAQVTHLVLYPNTVKHLQTYSDCNLHCHNKTQHFPCKCETYCHMCKCLTITIQLTKL